MKNVFYAVAWAVTVTVGFFYGGLPAVGAFLLFLGLRLGWLAWQRKKALGKTPPPS